YTNALAGTAINLTSAPGSDETQKYNFTKHSDNPALAFRDYLTNTQYGLNAGTSEINDTNFTSVANTCEESVTLDSGTENSSEDNKNKKFYKKKKFFKKKFFKKRSNFHEKQNEDTSKKDVA
ncbi:MAG: hypothetical protein EBW63_04440, partial [Proteobacteria bacterium]|nr:hypothetical protein [Pseudomonadota bacterium]